MRSGDDGSRLQKVSIDLTEAAVEVAELNATIG